MKGLIAYSNERIDNLVMKEILIAWITMKELIAWIVLKGLDSNERPG